MPPAEILLLGVNVVDVSLNLITVAGLILLVVWNILLTIQNRRRKKELTYLCNYLTDFTLKYNISCRVLSNHSTTISILTENDFLNLAANQQISQAIMQLEGKIQELIENMDDGSGYGESWKKGYRPDGSETNEEE